MSDDRLTEENDSEEPAEQAVGGRPGPLADPVVRFMLYASLGLVIVYLAAAIGVLGTGVTEHTSPRTRAEKELVVASGRIDSKTKGEDFVPYISAQIAAGDRTGARATLMQARASASTTSPAPALDLTEARLAQSAGDSKNAIKWADKAMQGYRTAYEAKLAKAKADGDESAVVRLHGNYYNAALVKAYALVEVGRLKEAVKMFDLYLKSDLTASDVFIDRGEAKLKLGDKKGAEKDFREALRYVPYDERAKSGLEKIGVAK